MRLKFKIRYVNMVFYAVVAMFFTMFWGCERHDFDDVSTNEYEVVECALNFSVEPTTLISELTKASTPSTSFDSVDDEAAVKNVWILQYNNDGEFVGSATYISNVGDKDGEGKRHIASVNLLKSEENATTSELKENKIVLIANTFNESLFTSDNMSSYSSIDLLKKMSYQVSTTSDDGSYIENFGLSTDGEGKHYIVMSSTTSAVVDNKDITCSLKYNLARINVKLENKNNDYTPISIRMKAVPVISKYLINEADFSSADGFPKKSEFKPTDYDAIVVGTQKDFTFYMPANIRGNASQTNTLPENKPLYADSYNTYIEVIAQKNDGDDKVTYSFYLGEDLTNNFDIKPNYEYDYTLTIENFDEETIKVDSRVELSTDNVFDYTRERPSNCYILNPSTEANREYFIPIAKRINEFWGGNGYESDSNNVINEGDDDYYVELGWYDFYDSNETNTDTPNLTSMSLDDITDIIEFNPKEVAPSGLNGMKVTLKSGAQEGNVTVSIVRGTGDEKRVLWSWHFWITDYNPYSTARYKNEYAMTVDGGEVHSYAGDYWEGVYAGHYIMDRDIGAKNDNDGTRSLLYQFGRKDPFRVYGTPGKWGYYKVVKNTPTTVKEMVQNPTNFYSYYTDSYTYSNYFPQEGKYNNTSLIWCDPKINTSVINTPQIYKKSIFDPSPLGWMVPTYYVWKTDFEDEAKSVFIKKDESNDDVQRDARFYHPGATTLSPPTKDNYIALYPVNGTLLDNGGEFHCGSGYNWGSQPYPYNPAAAYMMLFRTSKEVTAQFTFYRWNGRAVRPVTE